jgi:glycosyltransferase involved in cell wall biosynthesis
MVPRRLSVIVPAFNNADALEVTLASLTRQTMPAEQFDVIVADDGSAVPLGAAVDRFGDRIAVFCVRSEHNRGRAAIRNLGAAQAQADVLLFLDSDSVAHPALLDRHAAFHDRRAAQTGVLLGRRFEIDWVAADALRRGEPVTPAMVDHYRADSREYHITLPQHWIDFRHAPWVVGFSHNVSLDRATFEAVGGFDAAMVRWGLEDVEFCYRVFHHHQQDLDLFEYDADAIAYHLPHYRPAGLLAATMDNINYVTRKHPRYDFEALHAAGPLAELIGRARMYGESIRACRRSGLGRPERLPAELRSGLSAGRVLVAGFGAAEVPLGEGSHTFDHDAPPSATNWHLLGVMMHFFKTGQFETLVNIDMWRFFTPTDLSVFVTKGLTKADEIQLVATRTPISSESMLPLPFVSDVEYVAQMLGSHFKVQSTGYDDVTVLSIR